jgi:hypothetical protein
MRARPIARAALRAAPVLLLLTIAAGQQWLARRHALSPWLGGGFGMFSTLDALAARHLHAFLWTEESRIEVEVTGPLAPLRDRALALPSEANLRALARALARSAPGSSSAVLRVEIQVFGRRYDPRTLEPEGVLLRALAVPVGGS